MVAFVYPIVLYPLSVSEIRKQMRLNRFYTSKQRLFSRCLSLILIGLIGWLGLGTAPSLASVNNDTFDGNIFALYGGNGSLIPPRIPFADSLKSDRPTLLVLYLDDSRDCKQYTRVVSQLQAFYGRILDFVPVSVDQVIFDQPDHPTSPIYYYKGQVPQTVLFDSTGNKVFEVSGNVPFEIVDDALRHLFNFPPRETTEPRNPQSVNEFNAELTQK